MPQIYYSFKILQPSVSAAPGSGNTLQTEVHGIYLEKSAVSFLPAPPPPPVEDSIKSLAWTLHEPLQKMLPGLVLQWFWGIAGIQDSFPQHFKEKILMRYCQQCTIQKITSGETHIPCSAQLGSQPWAEREWKKDRHIYSEAEVKWGSLMAATATWNFSLFVGYSTEGGVG